MKMNTLHVFEIALYKSQGTDGRLRRRQLDDALRNKKALVIPMILEAFGGISPHSLHFIRRLALRAKGARARDSTVYGG